VDFRDLLTTRYPALKKENFTVFPNVPDLSQRFSGSGAAPAISADTRRPVVLYFGVVAERRGVFDVLKVFEELAREKHPSRFLIIGPVDKADGKGFLIR
jgi:glycosyltransferase involved in cell wall biosynthesis